MPDPKRYLIICSSPRTGSTLLSTLLVEAGLASGSQEFFEPGQVMPRHVFPELGLTIDDVLRDFDGYVEKIKARWGEPGKYFCVKLHWRDFRKFPKKLQLERLFPGARYLSCVREDLVLQAISNYRANATQGWAHGLATRPDPDYDFERIRSEVDELRSFNEGWDGYFRERGIEPYRTTYEALDADYRKVIRDVSRWLGMPIGFWSALRLRSPMRKQRDEKSLEWRERFLRASAR